MGDEIAPNPHLPSVATSSFSRINPSQFNRSLSISQMRNRGGEKRKATGPLQTTIERAQSVLLSLQEDEGIACHTPARPSLSVESKLAVTRCTHATRHTRAKTVISVPQHLQRPEGEQPGNRGGKASS